MVVKVKSLKTVIIDPKTVHIINHLKGVDFGIHVSKIILTVARKSQFE